MRDAPISVEVIPAPAPPAPAPPAPLPPAPTPPAKSHSPKAAAAAAHVAAPRPVARQSIARRTHAADSPLSASDEAPTMGLDAEVSEAELAGAAGAGSGGGGGGGACDMAARVQAALRKDGLVRSALSSFGGRAIRVWNGDWIRSLSEDGKGLAAVREAMMWEVAFAPRACRSEPVHGLVVMSVDGPAGRVRLALGTGEWRWSDLLASQENISVR
jgi:hypothetical protein